MKKLATQNQDGGIIEYVTELTGQTT